MATTQERIAAAIKDVTSWDGLDIDKLYDEKFPSEVDRHKFRQACMNARGAANEAKSAANKPKQQEPKS